ncbi:MAG: hypothetical protein HFJ30_09930 [Clostridia bacterium]|nr:hypothetical protein [Clostridia bacterium]
METRKKDQNIMVNQLGLKQKNVLKVFIIIIDIILLLFFNVTVSCADLEDDEEIDVEEIKKEVVQASATIAEEPKLNAKIGLVFDRASKIILYEKNGLKQVPMASTTNMIST